jgi:excisionase family DNA binding protein
VTRKRDDPKKREPLLTIPDVAAILKVSEKQVRRYIDDRDQRKRLRSIELGRLIRIDLSDLENFISDRRRP